MDPFDEIKDNNKQYGDDGEKSVRYKAFISYRHCEPDKTIAKLLHRKLEYYRIPKELREKLSRNSLGRVFRDEAELPVTDSLSDAILEALRSTEYLIVICSPRLKESAWCMKEIEIFSKLHGKKNILPVLIEGEPEESFPESLFYEDVIEKDPEGNEVEVRIEKEPLAADTRKGTGSVRDAVIKLSAAMLGLNYDDLKQRHRVERLKRRTFFSGLIFFVVLIFLFQAIYFATTITRQKKELEMKYADNMAQNSEELLDMGYRMDALYAARSVLPDDPDDNLSADAFRALINASQIYKKDVYVPSAFISAPVMATSARVSPDAAIAVIGNESRYYIMDTKSGRVLDTFRSEYMSYAFYGSKGLIYAFDSKVYYYDYEAATTVLLYEGAVNIYDSPSGNVVIIENDDSVCGYRGSEQIWQLDFDELGIDCNLENSVFSVDFTEKGTYAICLMNIFPGDGSLKQWLMMVDTSDGALKLCVTEPVNGYNISYVAADEDTISMLVTDRVSYMDMRLVNYDISKKAVTDELDLGKEFFNKISRFDNRIIICSSDRVVIYDNKLEYINGFGVSSCPEDLLKIDDRLMVRNMYGELYSAESETAGMQMTEHYFGDKEGTEVSLFEYKEGAFYTFSKGLEGIIVYTMADGSAYQQIETLSDEEMDEQTDWEAYNCRDVFEALEGFDIDMYDFGRRSSDGKYYIVSLLDGSTHFYDAKSLEEIKTYYTFGGYINQFFYLEKYDCYCVTDDSLRIFNPEMEYLAAVDNIWYAWEDKTDGELCVMRDYGRCYKMKLMLYPDILKYVDELLEGYTPSGRIKEKYGL